MLPSISDKLFVADTIEELIKTIKLNEFFDIKDFKNPYLKDLDEYNICMRSLLLIQVHFS